MPFNIKKAKRINDLPPYLFAEIDRKKRAALARGVDIIDLGIGDPDIPTPSAVVEKLVECAIEGEGWAVMQVADRLDGKPAQESTLNVNDKRERTDWNISDMVRALREHRELQGRPDSEVRSIAEPDKIH